jgi:GrpB-like predicted nucleotidyltransferase (UPF0157 family)/RimJ/RimL family protein N-acetyltransferase
VVERDADAILLAVDEDELRRITIGEPRRLDGEVTLVAYDPAWPERYTREAARIRAALGPRARRIEHVGSTSIPGLTAKPRIDIVLAVGDSADEPSYAPALEAAGYALRIREPEWHEHRMFEDTGVNLHVFTLGSPEITRMTRFRDRLRADRADRERYAAAKRDLAGRRWRYVQDYADAKHDVVAEIMARAMAPVIRPFAVADAAELAALYLANREHLRRFEPIRADAFFTAAGQAARARSEAVSAEAGRRYAHVILDGTAIAGTIAIDNIVRGAGQMASIGYWVDQARAGRGLATLAVAAAVETAFETLELHRVQAGTLLDNRASQRVLEKNGFERFGMAPRYLNIAGRWQDHFVYQRLAD